MKTTTPNVPALPAGIIAKDLKAPTYNMKTGTYTDPLIKDWEQSMFELWYTERMGWCIPTLLISRAGRRAAPGASDRTYAVAVKDGAMVRIGLGPHVLAKHTVYVRQSRLAALQKFLDLRQTGAVRANEIRDRISSRRAQGAMYRMRRGW
jgi:hypothetical protein